jgi:hypothetical protein
MVIRNAEEYSCSDGEDESCPSDDDNDPTDWCCIRAALSAAATDAFVGVAAHLLGIGCCSLMAGFVGNGF